jgi:hypothetical protein
MASGIVQVFGRLDEDADHAILRPVSEKRQGTKSREVRRWGCCGLYEDLAACRGLENLDRRGRRSGFWLGERCCVEERTSRLHVARRDWCA